MYGGDCALSGVVLAPLVRATSRPGMGLFGSDSDDESDGGGLFGKAVRAEAAGSPPGGGAADGHGEI
eukprot:COSAG02_NODE_13703_length_1359_cov_1.769841_2_plen_67_part_00